MESQPQNPEFRTNPEHLHPRISCIQVSIILIQALTVYLTCFIPLKPFLLSNFLHLSQQYTKYKCINCLFDLHYSPETIIVLFSSI